MQIHYIVQVEGGAYSLIQVPPPLGMAPCPIIEVDDARHLYASGFVLLNHKFLKGQDHIIIIPGHKVGWGSGVRQEVTLSSSC